MRKLRDILRMRLSGDSAIREISRSTKGGVGREGRSWIESGGALRSGRETPGIEEGAPPAVKRLTMIWSSLRATVFRTRLGAGAGGLWRRDARHCGMGRHLGRDSENQGTVERHLGQSEAPPLWILALG